MEMGAAFLCLMAALDISETCINPPLLAYRDIDYCQDLLRSDLSGIVDITLSYGSDDLVVILLQPVKELHISRFAFLIRPFMNRLGHLSAIKLIAFDLIVLLDLLCNGYADLYIGVASLICSLCFLNASFMT